MSDLKTEPGKSHYAEQWDSPFRWVVRSRSSSKDSYLSDIKKWRCQCKDYRTRHQRFVTDGGDRELHSCFHLRCAAEEWWDTHIQPNINNIPVIRNLPDSYVRKHMLRLAISLLADLPEEE